MDYYRSFFLKRYTLHIVFDTRKYPFRGCILSKVKQITAWETWKLESLRDMMWQDRTERTMNAQTWILKLCRLNQTKEKELELFNLITISHHLKWIIYIYRHDSLLLLKGHGPFLTNKTKTLDLFDLILRCWN